MTDLWIEKIKEEKDSVDLRLAGQLVGRGVSLLESECSTLQGKRIALDLTGVTFLSAAGSRLLRRLTRQGICVRGCSPLIAEMLEDPGNLS